jgi:hypothetical protein
VDTEIFVAYLSPAILILNIHSAFEMLAFNRSLFRYP